MEGTDFELFKHHVSVCIDQNPLLSHEKRSESYAFIQSMMSNRYWTSLEFSVRLFNEGASHSEIAYCAIIVIDTLRPSRDPRMYARLIPKARDRWFEENKGHIRSAVKGSMMRGLSHAYPPIRATCAAAIGFLVKLDESQWPIIVNILGSNVVRSEVNIHLKYGSMRALANVFDRPEMTSERISSVDGLRECIMNIMRVMSDAIAMAGLEMGGRVDAVALVRNAIRYADRLFANPDIVGHLIESVARALPSSDKSLYRLLHMVLFELVKHFYDDIAGGLFSRIENLVTTGMTTGNPEARAISVAFWKRLAKLEKEKMDSDPSHVRGYVQSAPHIQQILCVIMSEITDPKNYEIEDDLNEMEPHIVARETLSMIYSFDSANVLATVSAFFYNNINSDQWTKVHGAILAVTCLCVRVDYSHAYDFLVNAISAMVRIASTREYVARLRETSLWAVACCIRTYPGMLKQGGLVDMIIEMLRTTIGGPPAVVKRCCSVICYLCEGCCGIPLDSLVDRLMGFVWPKIRDKTEQNWACAKYPFYAVSAIVRYTTNAVRDGFVGIIQQLLDNIADPRLPYDIRAGNCIVMTSIATKFARELPGVDIILMFLVNTMRSDQGIIWDEVLMTTSAVLRCGGSRLASIGREVYSLIKQAVTSKNKELAIVAWGTLGALYYAFPEEMSDLSGESLTLVFQGMEQHGIVPQIIECLTLIMRRTGESLTEEHLQTVADFLYDVTVTKFESHDDDDVLKIMQDSITCYCAIFIGLRKSASHSDFLKRICNPVFDLVERLWRLDLFDHDMLHELYLLFYAAGIALKQKVNVKLNKPAVRKLIEEGLNSDNPELQKESAFIRDFTKGL